MNSLAHTLTKSPVRDCTMRCLILILSALGLADLLCTLTLMATVGMFESNPLAAALARCSPWALVVFKLATMAISMTCLWLARRNLLGWVGGGVCLAAMAVLTAHWVAVLDVTNDAVQVAVAMHAANDAQWVCLNSN